MRFIIAALQVFLCRIYRWFYSIKVVTDQNEKEKIFKFRYQIYIKELNVFSLRKSVIHADSMYDDEDFDDSSILISGKYKGEVIGTIRMSFWQKDNLPRKFINKYRITPDILSHITAVSEISYFQIAKPYRKSLFALALFDALYEAYVAKLNLIPNIIFADCMPGLLPYYLSVGCYIYTKEPALEDALLIPLAYNPFDEMYLYQSKSVNRFLATWYLHLIKAKVTTEAYTAISKNYNDKILHLPAFLSENEIQLFRKKIVGYEKQQCYDFIISLFEKVTVLTISKNITIIKKDLIDSHIFLLIHGTLAVYIDKVEVARLRGGDLFGEMSILTPLKARHADVRSLTEVKIILIPRNLLSSLEKKNKDKALTFLHILCKNLSEKLSHMNKRRLSQQETLVYKNKIGASTQKTKEVESK